MSEWIKCSERQPEIGQGVLISDGKLVTAAKYAPAWHTAEDGGRQWWWFDALGYGGCDMGAEYRGEDVTHWMPLPLPPTRS